MPKLLRTCSTKSLRSQRERVGGCVEITMQIGLERVERVADGGERHHVADPAVEHSSPSPRRMASVRSSRSWAASMAPA